MEMLRSKEQFVESDLSRQERERQRKAEKFLTCNRNYYYYKESNQDSRSPEPWRWPGEAQQVTQSAVRRTAAQSWNCILLHIRLFFTRPEDQRWGYSIIHQSCWRKAAFTFCLVDYIKSCLHFSSCRERTWIDFTFISICLISVLYLLFFFRMNRSTGVNRSWLLVRFNTRLRSITHRSTAISTWWLWVTNKLVLSEHRFI